MSFTNFLEDALLNHIFTDPIYSAPTNIFVGISSTTPSEDGTGFSEEAANGYARVSTAAADWGTVVAAEPSTKSNVNIITFPIATGDWQTQANFTYFGLFDLATVGELLAFGLLTVAKNVLDGDTAKFPVGDLTITLQ